MKAVEQIKVNQTNYELPEWVRIISNLLEESRKKGMKDSNETDRN